MTRLRETSEQHARAIDDPIRRKALGERARILENERKALLSALDAARQAEERERVERNARLLKEDKSAPLIDEVPIDLVEVSPRGGN